eukprot:g73623.t1
MDQNVVQALTSEFTTWYVASNWILYNILWANVHIFHSHFNPAIILFRMCCMCIGGVVLILGDSFLAMPLLAQSRRPGRDLCTAPLGSFPSYLPQCVSDLYAFACEHAHFLLPLRFPSLVCSRRNVTVPEAYTGTEVMAAAQLLFQSWFHVEITSAVAGSV